MPRNRAAGLSPLQEKAIVALLNEGVVTRAAHAAGVGERTLYRWMVEDREFMRKYRRLRREAYSQAVGIAQRVAPAALSNLIKIAADPTAPHPSRVAASIAILRFGKESIEVDDLAERVETIEDGTPRVEVLTIVQEQAPVPTLPPASRTE